MSFFYPGRFCLRYSWFLGVSNLDELLLCPRFRLWPLGCTSARFWVSRFCFRILSHFILLVSYMNISGMWHVLAPSPPIYFLISFVWLRTWTSMGCDMCLCHLLRCGPRGPWCFTSTSCLFECPGRFRLRYSCFLDVLNLNDFGSWNVPHHASGCKDLVSIYFLIPFVWLATWTSPGCDMYLYHLLQLSHLFHLVSFINIYGMWYVLVPSPSMLTTRCHGASYLLPANNLLRY